MYIVKTWKGLKYGRGHRYYKVVNGKTIQLDFKVLIPVSSETADSIIEEVFAKVYQSKHSQMVPAKEGWAVMWSEHYAKFTREDLEELIYSKVGRTCDILQTIDDVPIVFRGEELTGTLYLKPDSGLWESKSKMLLFDVDVIKKMYEALREGRAVKCTNLDSLQSKVLEIKNFKEIIKQQFLGEGK